MATDDVRNKAYNEVTRRFVESGRALHYTELAPVLGVSLPEALRVQREVVNTSLACWFTPETDNLASWAPFSNIPNQHRVTVRGEQKWFGQCGAEVLATPIMFPEEEVLIESCCPHSGMPITVRIKDGEVLEITPATAVVLINQPFDRLQTPFSPGGEYSLPYS